MAIVQAPRSLPRVVACRRAAAAAARRALDHCRSLRRAAVQGMEVLGCYQFRLTRNSDLFVDDEEVDDLRRALEGELAHRRYGAAVRLETAPTARTTWSISCCSSSLLEPLDWYRCPGRST
jgi:polyphosphate kinase